MINFYQNIPEEVIALWKEAETRQFQYYNKSERFVAMQIENGKRHYFGNPFQLWEIDNGYHLEIQHNGLIWKKDIRTDKFNVADILADFEATVEHMKPYVLPFLRAYNNLEWTNGENYSKLVAISRQEKVIIYSEVLCPIWQVNISDLNANLDKQAFEAFREFA
jgi:hypothetical protein